MATDLQPIGLWSSQGASAPAYSASDIEAACHRVREPVHVVRDAKSGKLGVAFAGEPRAGKTVNGAPSELWMATLPALYPEWLGDRSFQEVHGVRFPYCTGAMANGIATTRLVIAMARARMLGFFGAAGLEKPRVEAAVDELVRELGGSPELAWGVNLIHSPQEPELEAAVADLLIQRGVRRVEASAFMALTPAIVRYAVVGLRERPDGTIERRHHVFAKISRPEVARPFLMPAPQAILDALLSRGLITSDEARLARRVPIAEDVTVESDSGGHTDNRPLGAVFPIIMALRDEIAREQGYTRPIRVGAAGGLGTPSSVASAFALGASYVLTGSVNQAAIESGLSEAGRVMLAQAGLADVIMAPAADMFEMGVKVQVLRRGTMFGTRGLRLYEVYHSNDSLESLAPAARAKLEKEVLGTSVDEVWAATQSFWRERDPRELEKAAANPKHKMALCFRWYLGLSSRWAITGEPSRRLDYQIWCGPAMGAFNDWAKGSFLEKPEARTAVQIARNLLEGAAVVTRAQQLRTYGVPVPTAAFRFAPRPLE
ncbi:PfaD family polyunsaturated fatty acid/polyketide biosynthesis protein [Sandaracinus amylolyticus]|uniref:Enoyl-[acyl-carrier-protein] reductase n=1 Tax=Sandaracinus amylolyticus TaxID=927083 RepID=A0A0F6W1R6_9BACT|nr:PfaD family polyunsaturated fatty acid/polyketide biosynthesis protein [Sandaracinus amylolyticus]AKF05217.1 Enoyl-[acyl-carrier-protein] reductase [Sandaracinus amylolyticus]